MGASRTRKLSEADAVANAEGNTVLYAMARVDRSDGVCVASMHENVQPRNLGGPIFSSFDSFWSWNILIGDNIVVLGSWYVHFCSVHWPNIAVLLCHVDNVYEKLPFDKLIVISIKWLVMSVICFRKLLSNNFTQWVRNIIIVCEFLINIKFHTLFHITKI